MRALPVLALAALACGACRPSEPEPVRGRAPACEVEDARVVRVGPCTGYRLDARHILTAAHCACGSARDRCASVGGACVGSRFAAAAAAPVGHTALEPEAALAPTCAAAPGCRGEVVDASTCCPCDRCGADCGPAPSQPRNGFDQQRGCDCGPSRVELGVSGCALDTDALTAPAPGAWFVPSPSYFVEVDAARDERTWSCHDIALVRLDAADETRAAEPLRLAGPHDAAPPTAEIVAFGVYGASPAVPTRARVPVHRAPDGNLAVGHDVGLRLQPGDSGAVLAAAGVAFAVVGGNGPGATLATSVADSAEWLRCAMALPDDAFAAGAEACAAHAPQRCRPVTGASP